MNVQGNSTVLCGKFQNRVEADSIAIGRDHGIYDILINRNVL
jgi:hypothetical protein